MNKEAQRIAIAEAVGWTAQQVEAWKEVRRLRSEYRGLPKRESFSGWTISDKIEKAENSKDYRGDLPDYLTDLNAMHEAEKVILDMEIGARYRLELSKNSDGPTSMFMTVEAAMCHATAAQRAEAFLRTLNLWTDDDCRAQESE